MLLHFAEARTEMFTGQSMSVGSLLLRPWNVEVESELPVERELTLSINGVLFDPENPSAIQISGSLAIHTSLTSITGVLATSSAASGPLNSKGDDTDLYLVRWWVGEFPPGETGQTALYSPSTVAAALTDPGRVSEILAPSSNGTLFLATPPSNEIILDASNPMKSITLPADLTGSISVSTEAQQRELHPGETLDLLQFHAEGVTRLKLAGALHGMSVYENNPLLFVVGIDFLDRRPTLVTFNPVVDGLESADFDANGTVDQNDLDIWALGFDRDTLATNSEGDADFDGDVDGSDFLLWQRRLGASQVTEAVPELRSLSSLAAAISISFLLRRRNGTAGDGVNPHRIRTVSTMQAAISNSPRLLAECGALSRRAGR
jgi:hypothetical protein